MNANSSTKVSNWLKANERLLKDTGIFTARLDCLVLLEDQTGKDRAWLLAHPEYELQGSEVKNLSTKVAQRAKHVPLAYLRGKAEFYGREFIVNAHTLVPRPETETMIELLKVVRNRESNVAVWETDRRKKSTKHRHYAFEKAAPASSLLKTDKGFKVVWTKESKDVRTPNSKRSILVHHDDDLLIIDIGTGSGAVAITAKLELPEATVIATDIDEKCIETAEQNAHHLGADITLNQGNLLAPLQLPAHKTIILLCNLPYVPDNFQINTAATHEPRHALFGGPDGLDLYRELFAQIVARTNKPSYVLTESLPLQHEELASIAEAADYACARTDDFIQLFELV